MKLPTAALPLAAALVVAACDGPWTVGRAARTATFPSEACVRAALAKAGVKLVAVHHPEPDDRSKVHVYGFEGASPSGNLRLDLDAGRVELFYAGIAERPPRVADLRASIDALYAELARECRELPPMSQSSVECFRASCD